MTFDFYILVDGEAVAVDSLEEWGIWMSGSDDRLVRQTLLRLPDRREALVSTVFLGIDHGFGCAPRLPVLWETMIFAEGVDEDGRRRPAASQVEALQDHEELVVALRGRYDARLIRVTP